MKNISENKCFQPLRKALKNGKTVFRLPQELSEKDAFATEDDAEAWMDKHGYTNYCIASFTKSSIPGVQILNWKGIPDNFLSL